MLLEGLLVNWALTRQEKILGSNPADKRNSQKALVADDRWVLKAVTIRGWAPRVFLWVRGR
jgi:hypothetical protein